MKVKTAKLTAIAKVDETVKAWRWFLAFEYSLFAILFVICLIHYFVSTSVTTSAGFTDEDGTTLLTLEDYLADESGNCFTEQLAGYQADYNELVALRDEFAAVMDASNWDGDVYIGDTYQLPSSRFDSDISDAYMSGSGLYVSAIRIYEGFTYDIEQRNGYLSVLGELNNLANQARAQFDELAMIYSGFSVVGYNTGGSFSYTPRENDIFSGPGWRNLNRTLYGTGVTGTAVQDVYEEPSKTEKYIAEPIGNAAWNLYKWMYKWDIDLTVDGMVFGRMASSYKGTADFTHFGLENNNPYGIVGASAYYVLRRSLLQVMPVVLVIMLIAQLFKNSNKGRAQLKDAAQNFLFVVVLLFLFPYALNFMIYIRDALIKTTSVGMSVIFNGVGLENESLGGSVVGMLYSVYYNSHSFLNALLLAAAVGSGFVYFVTYVKMAVLLCGCFAISPLIFLISIWNRKILKDWFNVFFPNLCAPLIDLILLQIPSIVLLVYKLIVGGSGSIVLGIVLMVIMWVTMAVREFIIKLLGFAGLSGGRGIGGAMAGMMILMRQLGNNRQRSDGGGNRDVLPDRESSREAMAYAHSQRELAGRVLGEEMPMIEGEQVSFEPNLAGETDAFLRDMDSRVSFDTPEFGSSAFADAGMDAVNMSAGLDDVGVDSAAGFMGAYNDGISDLPEFGEDASFMPAGNVSMGENGIADYKDTAYLSEFEPVNSPEMYNVGPVVDQSFRDGLKGEGEQKRYDNLAQMDGYNEAIQQNEATMRNSGYRGREQYEADLSRFREQSEQLDKHINHMTGRMEHMDKGSDAYAAEKKQLEMAYGRKADIQNRVAQLHHAAGLEMANNVYRQRVSECMQHENRYAKIAGYNGMNNTAYASGRDYRYDHMANENRRKLANFKNFDTKRYESVLTPRERIDFYREREKRQMQQRVFRATVGAAEVGAKVAVGSAGVGAAVLAAGTFAYGGVGASSTAASLTVLAGGATGKRAGRIVRTAGDGIGNVNEHIARYGQNKQYGSVPRYEKNENAGDSAKNKIEHPKQDGQKRSERDMLRELKRRSDEAKK